MPAINTNQYAQAMKKLYYASLPYIHIHVKLAHWRQNDISLLFLFPHSVAYMGPAVTTHTGLNLGFRIYTMDGDYNDTTNVCQPTSCTC